MLADPDHAPTSPSLSRVARWNDTDIIEQLEACDEKGGFVLNHDGLNDVVHDERCEDGSRPLPRLSAAGWVSAHRQWRKEWLAGWATRLGEEVDLSERYGGAAYRVNRWGTTNKRSLGRDVIDPDTGEPKIRITFNGSDGRWGRDGEFIGDSLNDHAPMVEPSDNGWDGLWYDGIRFAAAEVVRFTRDFGSCSVSVSDFVAAYRSCALAKESRRHHLVWVLDPSKPVPAHVLAGEQPRPEDCCLLELNRLPFGTVHAVNCFSRLSRAINALYLWPNNPVLLEYKVPEEELSLATYLDDNAKISTERYADIAHARFLALATKCGLECEPSKDRPPSSVEQLYLGCLLHIEAQQLRVPPERVEDGVVRLREMLGRKCTLRSDFESLVGILNHYADCIPYARLFLRRCWLALAFCHGRWMRLTGSVGRGIKVDLQ